MHSITVSAYLPSYKFGALDRLWFAYTLAMAYVDAQLLVFFNIMLCLEYKKTQPIWSIRFPFLAHGI